MTDAQSLFFSFSPSSLVPERGCPGRAAPLFLTP